MPRLNIGLAHAKSWDASKEDVLRMRSRMIRTGVIAATILATCLLLASLTAGAETAIVHLTYGSHATEWHQWLERMAARFEAKTGIKVDIEVGPGGAAYREQVMVRTAGGVPPDVTDFNPGQAAVLIKEGLFEDLRPYVARSGIDLSQYPPVGIEGMTAPDGTMWGFAVSLLPIPVYFNVDMFAKAGLLNPIQLGDDWTWETYLASARALTIRDGEGNVIQSGTIDPRYRWELTVHQAGGMVYDRHVFPTRSRFNSPEVLAGIEFRMQMYNEGLIATTGGVWAGNAALTMIDAPTIINKFVGGFQMDVALQPKGPGGRGALVNPDGFQIHAHSKNKEAAWRWIEFLVTDEEGLMEFAIMTGRLPSLRNAMLRYEEVGLARNELTPNWIALIQTAFSADAFPPYVVPDTEITGAVSAALNSIWSGKVAPRVALEQLHEQVEALLAANQ